MVVTKCFCVLLCLLAAARCGLFEELDREKRAISSVCVEVKPSPNDKSQHSYFMCKGRAPSRHTERAEDFGPERHSLSLDHEPFGFFPDDHMNFAEKRMDTHPNPYYFVSNPLETRREPFGQERRIEASPKPTEVHSERSRSFYDQHYQDKIEEAKSSMKLIFETGHKDNPNVLFMTSGQNQPSPIVLPPPPHQTTPYTQPPHSLPSYSQETQSKCCLPVMASPCKQPSYPPQQAYFGGPYHDVLGAPRPHHQPHDILGAPQNNRYSAPPPSHNVHFQQPKPIFDHPPQFSLPHQQIEVEEGVEKLTPQLPSETDKPLFDPRQQAPFMPLQQEMEVGIQEPVRTQTEAPIQLFLAPPKTTTLTGVQHFIEPAKPTSFLLPHQNSPPPMFEGPQSRQFGGPTNGLQLPMFEGPQSRLFERPTNGPQPPLFAGSTSGPQLPQYAGPTSSVQPPQYAGPSPSGSPQPPPSGSPQPPQQYPGPSGSPQPAVASDSPQTEGAPKEQGPPSEPPAKEGSDSKKIENPEEQLSDSSLPGDKKPTNGTSNVTDPSINTTSNNLSERTTKDTGSQEDSEERKLQDLEAARHKFTSVVSKMQMLVDQFNNVNNTTELSAHHSIEEGSGFGVKEVKPGV